MIFTDHNVTALEYGFKAVVIYTDLTKAFDRVDHNNLKGKYAISQNRWIWFKLANFLFYSSYLLYSETSVTGCLLTSETSTKRTVFRLTNISYVSKWSKTPPNNGHSP